MRARGRARGGADHDPGRARRAAFDGERVVLLETPGHAPLASLQVDSSRALLLLVGPAGGFEPSESAALREAGFTPASLGPRILRAETAAVAAVAIAQALWGDLRA